MPRPARAPREAAGAIATAPLRAAHFLRTLIHAETLRVCRFDRTGFRDSVPRVRAANRAAKTDEEARLVRDRSGARRSRKMGTTRSPQPMTPQPATRANRQNVRRPAISRYASSAAEFPPGGAVTL